jgi:hypothetical protein
VKVFKIILLIIFVLLAIICIIDLIPVKKAVKNSKLKSLRSNNSDCEIIICKFTQSTGPSWVIVEDENGLSNKKNLEGVILKKYNPVAKMSYGLFFSADNKFAFLGSFNGKEDYSNTGDIYRVFEVDEYFPIYPIERTNRLIYNGPKGHLSLFDYMKGNIYK